MFRSPRRNDDAVTEVIGYVLSFALSAIFLLISLSVFNAARANTEHVVTGVELKTIADQVATHIVEMGLVTQEFKNSSMDVTLLIPQSFNGQIYTITATPTTVTAQLNNEDLTATATTYKTDALERIDVTGSVDSSNERLVLHYRLLADSTALNRQITISGE